MVSIARAVGRIKDEWCEWISPTLILAACLEAGYVWRDRTLGPVATVQLFVLQVLHGNTAMTHLRHLTDLSITASGYCQARMRLPRSVLEQLAQRVTAQLRTATQRIGRWHEHRVFHIDGSSFSMPDTQPLQAHFGQPGGQRHGCGFPVASLMVLMDAASGLIVKAFALPLRIHEMAYAASMHPALGVGDVLVGDRGFCSYAHLSLVLQRQLHAVCRMHQRTTVSFKPGRRCARQMPKSQRKGIPASQWIKRLGPLDQLVMWPKPKQKPAWMTDPQYANLPDAITVRELRYRVERRGYRTKQVTLVTTLIDPTTYPAEDIAQLYGGRWQQEVNFRDLKQTMGMDVLRGKSVDTVMKELAVFTLVYNLVRMVMLQAAQNQNQPPDRISFIDALRWLRDADDSSALPTLIANPKRPDRCEPRVIKRRPKQYTVMRKPRQQLKQSLANKKLAA